MVLLWRLVSPLLIRLYGATVGSVCGELGDDIACYIVIYQNVKVVLMVMVVVIIITSKGQRVNHSSVLLMVDEARCKVK